MKMYLLSIMVLMAAAIIPPAHAASASGEGEPAGELFVHPSDDVSYTKDTQEDEALARAKPADNGKVKYISGGVSESGMKVMDTEANSYNLKMLFVEEPKGEYLADVTVDIADAQNSGMLNTVTRGPVLLVNMPPGHYTVTAKTDDGQTLTERVVAGNDHLSSYVFRFPGKGK